VDELHCRPFDVQEHLLRMACHAPFFDDRSLRSARPPISIALLLWPPRAGADQPPPLSMQPYLAQSSGFRLSPSVSGFLGEGTWDPKGQKGPVAAGTSAVGRESTGR
jgi:hypothetical protein